MNTYPEGAVSSINELLELKGTTVYAASRKFQYWNDAQKLTGVIGTKEYEDPRKWQYHWYEYQSKNDVKVRTSLLDRNVMKNQYNDWFLFANVEDARRWAGRCPCCGK